MAHVCLCLVWAELWTPARPGALLKLRKSSLGMLVHSSGCRASNCWGLVGEALAGALQMVFQHREEAYSLLSESFGPQLHLDSPPTHGQKM